MPKIIKLLRHCRRVKACWQTKLNPSSNIGRDKSFVDDLNKELGIVRMRVAFVPRSAEIQPTFWRFVITFTPPLLKSKLLSLFFFKLNCFDLIWNFKKKERSSFHFFHYFTQLTFKEIKTSHLLSSTINANWFRWMNELFYFLYSLYVYCVW